MNTHLIAGTTMTTLLTTDLILDIIKKNPGLDGVNLNLTIYKEIHPKEVDYINLRAMLDDLINSYQVRRLVVSGDGWSKFFFFPVSSRFYFS